MAETPSTGVSVKGCRHIAVVAMPYYPFMAVGCAVLTFPGVGGDGAPINLLCCFKCVKFYEWVVLLLFYDERCYDEGGGSGVGGGERGREGWGGKGGREGR